MMITSPEFPKSVWPTDVTKEPKETTRSEFGSSCHDPEKAVSQSEFAPWRDASVVSQMLHGDDDGGTLRRLAVSAYLFSRHLPFS